ncbi:ketopantoate reductase family protein [Bradyrhizobium genosp. P]|uniref:ketopantoate reductase family protein n=1 Tax=Bradyrhizobium genosp. P TaxID=83641 RepID=UPI003CEAEF9D
MRILVVGAGSIGGYFGGRLAQAGRDVTFLVRPARAEFLRQNGLQIISPDGDVTLTPKLVTAETLSAQFDVVLLTAKGFSLDAALTDLAPAVGPKTMILPVQNGMRHVDLPAERFGREVLVGCVCKVATILDDQGRIVQLTNLQDLAYGEMDRRASARIAELDAIMRNAGFDARLSADIELEMWEKWVLLATVGGAPCLMRGNLGEIEAAGGGSDITLRFLDETVTVVSAVGRTPSEPFVTAAKAQLVQKGSTQTSSMFRDLQKGRPVEVDQIIGDLVARARRAGVDTPLLDAVLTHLSVYQNRQLSQP